MAITNIPIFIYFFYYLSMKEAIVKGLVELARVAVLSAIPVLIASLEAGMVDWRSIAIVVAIAVLRALDKMIHLYGEATKQPFVEKGLTRF